MIVLVACIPNLIFYFYFLSILQQLSGSYATFPSLRVVVGVGMVPPAIQMKCDVKRKILHFPYPNNFFFHILTDFLS